MRLLVITGLACLPALAQATFPCEASASLEQLHHDLHASTSREDRIRMAREKLREDPGNLFLNTWYLEVAGGPDAVAEYKALLDQHPGDAAYLFLYGRALQATDGAAAVESLEQALAKEPRLPWARRSMAQIYLSAKTKDEAKAVDNMNAYIQLCPQNLDAYASLRIIKDRDFAAEGARRLRYLLSDRTDERAVSYYSVLWNTELRIAPPAELETVRGRIAEDLDRLKKADRPNDRVLAAILGEGSKLVGDAAAQVKAAPPENAAQALRDWNKEHPRPNPNDRAAQKKYARALLKAAEEWVKKYPDEFTPLHERFIALDMLDASKAELEAAGEALMWNEDKRAAGSGNSVRVHVAQVWLRRQIRVADIPAIVEKGMERRPGPEGWAVIADAYLELDKPFKAREVLDRMQEWLDTNKSVRSTLYVTTQGKYYLSMARLAEKQGSKLDALMYYQRAIATGRASLPERAHALWKDLGGTNEGWLVFSNPPAAAAAPSTTAPRVTSRAEVGKPLPALTLKDVGGKTWTLTSFQGKTTLINLWATWCAPCQKELPHLQKLYDKIKDQPGLQVVTLNVDEEIEKVQPYLTKNKYTFPVLLARTYVHALLPNLSIPRNWIVDKEARMREETIGFGGSGNQWIDNALAKLKE